MPQSPKESFALAVVIESIFPESFRQPVARRCCDRPDAEVGAKSLGVARSALLPFRRTVVCLVNPRRERVAHHGIHTKRTRKVSARFFFLGRAQVSRAQCDR